MTANYKINIIYCQIHGLKAILRNHHSFHFLKIWNNNKKLDGPFHRKRNFFWLNKINNCLWKKFSFLNYYLLSIPEKHVCKKVSCFFLLFCICDNEYIKNSEHNFQPGICSSSFLNDMHNSGRISEKTSKQKCINNVTAERFIQKNSMLAKTDM